MEFFTVVSLIFLTIILYWYLISRFQNRDPYSSDNLAQFSLEQLRELIENEGINYYLIDVRPEDTYKKGHIPTAINMPARTCNGLLPTDDLFILVIVYGANRKEANNVARILSQFGYFNVHLTEPIHRWKGQIESSGNYF